VICQTAPLVSESRPTKNKSIPTSSPGLVVSIRGSRWVRPPGPALGSGEHAAIRGGQPRVAERARNDALLDERGNLVGHRRPPALAGTQHLEVLALDLALPAVVGRAVHAHQAGGLGDPKLAGQRDQPHAITKQHVILSHADSYPLGWHRGA
jgi:hypothetical protein